MECHGSWHHLKAVPVGTSTLGHSMPFHAIAIAGVPMLDHLDLGGRIRTLFGMIPDIN
jgi:hypothetical protein